MNELNPQNNGNPNRQRRMNAEFQEQLRGVYRQERLREYETIQQGKSQRLREKATEKIKKTALQKAFPYLLVSGSTGAGIGLSLSDLIF